MESHAEVHAGSPFLVMIYALATLGLVYAIGHWIYRNLQKVWYQWQASKRTRRKRKKRRSSSKKHQNKPSTPRTGRAGRGARRRYRNKDEYYSDSGSENESFEEDSY